MLQNRLSSCLSRIPFGDRELDYSKYVSASYRDVFRAVLAAHGGAPPDHVVDAILECARPPPSLARRRRRRRSSRSVRGCRCRLQRPPARMSLEDDLPKTSHGVRHRNHRRRSVTHDGDHCGKNIIYSNLLIYLL